MSTTITRMFEGVLKSAEKNGPITFIASTSEPDRMEDIVVQKWRLERYKANPVVLQNHNSRGPVVGKAVRMEVVDGNLEIDVLMDESEDNPDGRRLARQLREGFVRAVSVGFLPHLVTPRSSLPETDTRRAKWGYLLDDNELLELSIVTVPANPEALAKDLAELDRRRQLDSAPPPPPAPPATPPEPVSDWW